MVKIEYNLEQSNLEKGEYEMVNIIYQIWIYALGIIQKRRGGGREDRRLWRTDVLSIVRLTDFGENTFFFFELIVSLTLKNRKTSSQDLHQRTTSAHWICLLNIMTWLWEESIITFYYMHFFASHYQTELRLSTEERREM